MLEPDENATNVYLHEAVDRPFSKKGIHVFSDCPGMVECTKIHY